MNMLAKFHHEKTNFDEIRGHLLILLFYRALIREPEGLLRKKDIKLEVEVLHTPKFRRPKYFFQLHLARVCKFAHTPRNRAKLTIL